MKTTFAIMLIIFCSFISSCATVELPKRENTTNELPELSQSKARVYFLAGMVQLKESVLNHPDPIEMMEGGDVFIDNNKIGYFYRDEMVVVDMPPGEYNVNWVTKLGEFDIKHTKSIVVKLMLKRDDIKYLVAYKDQGDSSGAMFGAMFGAIGALSGALSDSELFRTYFVEEKNNVTDLLKNKRIVSHNNLKIG